MINYDLCVINKKDMAGNDLNIKSKNRYCTVSCKEDWDFTLPGKVSDVRAGTYFMLSAQIEGQRTCVSSDINYDSRIPSEGGGNYFLQDLESLNKQIIAAYNDYLFWKKGTETSSRRHTVYCTEKIGTINLLACKPNQSEEYCAKCENVREIQKSTVRETKTWSVKQLVYQPGIEPGEGRVLNGNYRTFNETRGGWEDKEEVNHCTTKCNEKDFNWNDIRSNMNSAKSRYDSLLRTRQSYIDQIKSCSMWENDFKFDPKLSYNYEEYYYMNEIIRNDNYFTKYNEMETKNENTFWQTTHANEFYDNKAGTTGASQPEDKKITTCSGTTCTTQTITVPKNQNIMKVKANKTSFKPYTVWTVQHPNGEVMGTGQTVGNETGTNGQGVTKLGRVLPVRMTTPQGDYTYSFAFNQIGQFNDNELGRLLNYQTKNDKGLLPVNVNPQFVSNRTSLFDVEGLNASYSCEYNVYEDVCKCCGEDPRITGVPGTGGGGTGSGGGSYIDNGYFTYYYRPVSLNEMFPKDNNGYIDVGNNWQTDKGQKVMNEIMNAGEFAYREPEYSFRLTSEGMSQIRQYNQSRNGSGGLSDFNLTCNKYGYNCVSSTLNNLDNIVGYDMTLARDNGFEAYDTGLNHSEDKLPSGVGPAMK